MDEDVIADRNVLSREQGEADVAAHTLCLTAGEMANDTDDLHWDSETHNEQPKQCRLGHARFGNYLWRELISDRELFLVPLR